MTTYKVRNGVERAVACTAVGFIDLGDGKKWQVKVEPINRSLEQNNTFHMWMPEIANGYNMHLREGEAPTSPKAWKIWFKQQFLGDVSAVHRGETITREISTKDLNVKKMAKFMEKIVTFVHTELADYNIQLTQPED